MKDLTYLLSIARKPVPVYIYADLNARHTNLGHSSCNDRGRLLVNLIRRDILTNIGPDFKTFISDRGTGTPDIVLGNRHSNLNITLTQGPITTSDHIPIYSKLATKPIVIKGRKLLQIKKANWIQFKTIINDKLVTEEDNQTKKTKAQIDQDLENWFKVIKQAMERSIPSTEFTIMPHPRMSDKQKILQQRFNILKDHARRLGWTSASREIYKTIHRELNEECNRTYNENWTKLIKETENIYNEPKKFWKNIGRMMGAKEDRAPYLKTSNGDKVYKDNEKLNYSEINGRMFFEYLKKKTQNLI